MKQKQKIWVWIILVSFVFSSILPLGNNSFASAATVSGYVLKGTAFYASSAASSDFLPVYRLYKTSVIDHIYTISEEEKDSAVKDLGYALENTAFYAYPANLVAGTAPPEGLLPVYRLYNESTGSRIYTISETEKTNALTNSFILDPPASLDGVAFYAYSAAGTGLLPVYEFYNATTGDYIYTASENEKTTLLTEASETPAPTNLGPEISVGLWNNTKNSLSGTPYKIRANKNYNIKDASGNILAQVAAGTTTRVATHTVTTTQIIKDTDGGGGSSKKKKKKKKKKKTAKKTTVSNGAKVLGASTTKKTAVKKTAKKSSKKKKKKAGWLQYFVPTAYASDKIITTDTEYLRIYGDAVPEKKLAVQEIYFDAIDGNNADMIFDVYRPDSPYDQYRGKMKIKYTDNDNIWMINILPLEQYVWGMGEMAGDGPKEHSKVMTVIFRTYGKWYVDYATKYLPYGFRILSTSSSQIYSGYDHEAAYPNIKPVAESTRGILVTYKGETALTPYSSWSDGWTRSFEEHWGSKDYPWCQKVKDKYGKDSSRTTEQLFASGNHMVGLIAHGSLKMAKDHKKSYKEILNYYYTGIDDLAPRY